MNWLLLWFLNYQLFSLNALPQVKLLQGMVDGKLMISESGQKYFGFFGIPYALPPVGPLRFKVSLDAQRADAFLRPFLGSIRLNQQSLPQPPVPYLG